MQHLPGTPPALHYQQTKERSSDTVSTTIPFDPGASSASVVEGLDGHTRRRRRIQQSPSLGWIITLSLQKAFVGATSSNSLQTNWAISSSLRRDEQAK